MPLISVIIPTCNRADSLPVAVASVLGQTWPDLQLVVVDDGSTDETAELLQTIDDPRLTCLFQENRGVSAARNAGIAVAEGEWVTFLDSDDEAKPGWLAEIARLIGKRDNLGLVCCGHEVRYVGEQPVRSVDVLPKPAGRIYHNLSVMALSGTFAVRREVLRTVGGYAENLAYSENTELMLRIVEYCRENGLMIDKVDLPLTVYNRQPFDERAIAPAYYQDILAAASYILDHHRQLFERDPAELFNYNSVAGVNAARLGRFAEARKFFRDNLPLKPYSVKNHLRLLCARVPFLARLIWLKNGK